MVESLPYAYISCPCDSQPDFPPATSHARRSSVLPHAQAQDEEDKTLDPHDPRSNFTLYPYDQLLYCDECHQIRCPRCWTEEITHWYCPSCLFEVPSSMVKTDGNRCTRNCYNCPLCSSPVTINALDQRTKESGPAGPFFLACPYCEWSSLEAGIEFEKPNKITEQLHRSRRPKKSKSRETATPEREEQGGAPAVLEEEPAPSKDLPEHKFDRLVKFYRKQLAESDSAPTNPFGLDASYSSPSNLARIMQIYGGISAASLKKAREKPRPMREAIDSSEGLILHDNDDDESAAIARLLKKPESITTEAQRSSHPWNATAASTSDLYPVPALLTTRRSKRCRTCRHILIRHDDRKPTTTSSSSSTSATSSITGTLKYKIRLLARSHLPTLSLRPFTPLLPATVPQPRTAFALTPTALATLRDTDGGFLPLRPAQKRDFLLLVRNPLFDPVRVTLATPARTPGPVPSRVTLLCPSFEVGPDGDVWDAALGGGGGSGGGGGAAAAAAAAAGQGPSLAGGPGMFGTRERGEGAGGADVPVPEAGKVWERGRNWVGVVVEVVPGSVPAGSRGGRKDGGDHDEGHGDGDEDEEDYEEWCRKEKVSRRDRSVNGDMLEIPIFVRVEWEADITAEEGGAKGAREKREVAFWCVLGAGRIVP